MGSPEDDVGHIRAIAHPRDRQTLGIHPRIAQGGVQRLQEVEVVPAAPRAANTGGVFLAVALAPARIGKEHAIAQRRKALKLEIEAIADRIVRAAVDLQNQRVLLVRRRLSRFQQPGLDRPPIVSEHGHGAMGAEIKLTHPGGIDFGDPPLAFAVEIGQVHLAGLIGMGDDKGERLRAGAERQAGPLAIDDDPHPAIQARPGDVA